MKNLVIVVDDDLYDVILEEQFRRKMAKEPRTTVREVAADLFADCLRSRKSKKPDQK